MTPIAKNINLYRGIGDLDNTINYIIKITNESIPVFKDYAKSFNKGNLNDTSEAIWNFLKQNITYKHDRSGVEEIRHPERLLSDKIGDCEDFAIFTNTILSALGYHPFFYIVAFGSSYQHIYSGVKNDTGSYVIDAVWHSYNEHPDNITNFFTVDLSSKRNYYKQNPMYIEELAGIPETNIEHQILAAIEPGLAGFDDDNNILIYNETLDEIEDLIDHYSNSIDGLGSFKTLRDKINTAAVNIRNKINTAAVKTRKAVQSDKVTTFIKKTALAPARAPFLVLLKLNVFHMASKLYLGYITPTTASKLGISSEDHKKIIGVKDKFEKFWLAIGGNVEILRKNLQKGKSVKWVEKKTGQTISGLGDPVTATAVAGGIASSEPIWKKLLNLFKGEKGSFDKVLNSKAGTFVSQNFDKIKSLVTGNNDNSIINVDVDPDDTFKPKTANDSGSILPYAIGAGVLALLFL